MHHHPCRKFTSAPNKFIEFYLNGAAVVGYNEFLKKIGITGHHTSYLISIWYCQFIGRAMWERVITLMGSSFSHGLFNRILSISIEKHIAFFWRSSPKVYSVIYYVMSTSTNARNCGKLPYVWTALIMLPHNMVYNDHVLWLSVILLWPGAFKFQHQYLVCTFSL